MSLIDWLTAGLTVVVTAYLVYALFYPEKF
jgi:K+-transporting ATPase KdpF subunit